jgi:hypothetical protein
MNNANRRINNCKLVQVQKPTQTKVWVKASKHIKMGGNLWCAYGNHSEHHRKKKVAIAEIESQQVATKREQPVWLKEAADKKDASKEDWRLHSQEMHRAKEAKKAVDN